MVKVVNLCYMYFITVKNVQSDEKAYIYFTPQPLGVLFFNDNTRLYVPRT